MSPIAQQRLDLHNINTDFVAAVSGLCGFTHLASGRVCQRAYRHRGPCRLELQTDGTSESRTKTCRERRLAMTSQGEKAAG